MDRECEANGHDIEQKNNKQQKRNDDWDMIHFCSFAMKKSK